MATLREKGTKFVRVMSTPHTTHDSPRFVGTTEYLHVPAVKVVCSPLFCLRYVRGACSSLISLCVVLCFVYASFLFCS